MSSRRIDVAAVSGDALANEEIRRVEVPSLVNLWASCVTAGDSLGLWDELYGDIDHRHYRYPRAGWESARECGYLVIYHQ